MLRSKYKLTQSYLIKFYDDLVKKGKVKENGYAHQRLKSLVLKKHFDKTSKKQS